MTEQAKVPAIRFAGFTDPWEQRKLGELEKDATLYMGRGRVISAKDMSNTPGTFPVYSSSALDNGRMGAYGKYMFNQELITWSIDGGGAVFYRRKHRFSVTNVSGYIAVNPEKINCKFLAYAMSLAHSRIKFDYTVKAHPSVIRSLYTMGIPISLQEQQVIGSFFSRLDNLITLHQRKYDKLVIFKKSMLEKMFPKDGESVPEIRFAGFTDPWEQRKLGNCGTTYSGLSGKTKEDFGHGNARFVPYTNVFDNPLADTERLEAVEIDSSQNKVAYGDVFFTVSSETPDEVGMSSVWLSDQDDVYLNSFCFGYRQDSTFDPHYLAYMLRSSSIRSDLTLLAQGISRFNISKNKVMELSVAVPSAAEQKQIGQYFARLDSLITLHQRKLELLRNIKKSLLDKMFV
ncbi:restriction endonuclease subunit S [Bifidobacterium bifidum]|uniref:restriction endonuclease subunit S n=1 Tax=Bifidobacterium bifidum TaxID=1681 RepID=UPI003D368BA5